MDAVVQDGFLYVDVLNAGAMVGTGLRDQEVTDRGFNKNHWSFRVLVDFGQDESLADPIRHGYQL